MTPAVIALATIAVIVAIAAAVGFLAGLRRRMDLEQFTVGSRGFGTLLVFLLMAGEVFTTFAFLGVSGWAYSRGGPTLYVLAYLTLAHVVSFFVLPQVWRLGRQHALQTQADFFAVRYGNRYLAGFVCVVGIVSTIPYLQLQITGVGLIVQAASFGGISQASAMTVAVVLLVGFVFAGGVRAVAWVSVIKDALMLIAACVIGFGIPLLHFGGFGPMFAAIAQAHPGHLTMPGATSNLGHSWFISTVLLTAFGFYMWPHAFASTFTARSAAILRRNAAIMPLYSLTMALMLCAGFAAVLMVPGLVNGDLALLTVVRQTFPPWFLGLAGGAGALTAIVPAAIFILCSATLFAKNLVRPLIAPRMSDDQVAALARLMVLILGGISLALAVFSSSTLVSLLLTGYAGVTQFFPGVLLGVYWPRVTTRAVFAGMIAGVATALILMLSHHDPLLGVSAGFLALCLNFLIVAAVSLASPAGNLPSAAAAASRS